jgi:hypothetical protein
MKNDCLLRTALGANALFSATTGLAMAVFPDAIGSLIGLESAFLLMIVGLGLIVYSVYLLVLARGGMLTVLSLIATFGDLAWTTGTALLFAFAPDVFSSTGWAIASAVAIIVFLFGVLQLVGIRKHFLSGTSDTGERYQICFAIPVSVSEDAIWEAIRDVGSIHRFAPSLISSDVTAMSDEECVARTCTNIKKQRWTELIQVDELQKQLVVRFDADAPDFPFPVSSMSGGWRVLNGNEASHATVRVWWSFSLRKNWVAAILLPLLEIGMQSQMRDVVTNMETAIGPQSAAVATRRKTLFAMGGC